ncbi:MAG: nucleoside triphosphate pyrophosphohydrolase [Armatimonadetes bacterium]|nr:nucleoside triphosphate pyrophosphohydrolase [Armatimonadota bacterium]
MITVVGLGPGSRDALPERNLDALRSASRVILRTQVHPIVALLTAEGIAFESCDDLYESCGDFDELYDSIADRVLASGEGTVYAVPGHPSVGEDSVRILGQMTQIKVFAAPSFIDVVLAELGRSFSGSLQVWNAHQPDAHWPDARASQLVYQVDSQDAASEAKLRLLKFFPSDHPAHLVSRAGTDEAKVETVPLEELDHLRYDPLTSVYVEGLPLARPLGFYGLVDVVDRLLGPAGCPWDHEQTHESLKKHLLEEAYEVIEAIDSGAPDKLCEELGDLLLQSVMHAQMDAQEGLYETADVVAGITDKLVRRHPHVFGEVSVANSDEVLRNWDTIKQSEGKKPRSIVGGVPSSMPALLRATEVSERAVRVGFEWGTLEDIFSKLAEEEQELRQAIKSGNIEHTATELGEMLFTLVSIARWLKVDPEESLRRMVDRFTERFQYMETAAEKPLADLSLEEWDALWERSKAQPTI